MVYEERGNWKKLSLANLEALRKVYGKDRILIFGNGMLGNFYLDISLV